MTDKWTQAEAEALGKMPHDERVKMRLEAERLECGMCGDDASELRWTSESNGRGKPCDPTCQECYSPQSIGGDDSTGFPPACGVMDGPCFDDLPLAQQSAVK